MLRLTIDFSTGRPHASYMRVTCQARVSAFYGTSIELQSKPPRTLHRMITFPPLLPKDTVTSYCGLELPL
jgi:hypothetical protein